MEREGGPFFSREESPLLSVVWLEKSFECLLLSKKQNGEASLRQEKGRLHRGQVHDEMRQVLENRWVKFRMGSTARSTGPPLERGFAAYSKQSSLSESEQ